MNAREQAIADCVYGKSLSNSALMQHIDIWTSTQDILDGGEREYQKAIIEIASLLGTNSCLLDRG